MGNCCIPDSGNQNLSPPQIPDKQKSIQPAVVQSYLSKQLGSQRYSHGQSSKNQQRYSNNTIACVNKSSSSIQNQQQIQKMNDPNKLSQIYSSQIKTKNISKVFRSNFSNQELSHIPQET